MQVRDIMTRNIISLNPKTKVLEAIDILVNNRISGAPVLDDNGVLQGIISEKDLMVPLEFFSNRKETESCVEEFMAKNVITFPEDTSIEEIMKALVVNNIKRAPIIKDNKVVGIVSRRDILKYIKTQKDSMGLKK